MFSTGFLMSGVNQLVIDNFLCPVSGAVHLPDPFHLILSFDLFRNSFPLFQSLDQLEKHSLCLSIHFRQVAVQLAAEK